MHKKDGYYYLLVAEGGTFNHHMICVGRSLCIWGPYEDYQNNPIATARDTDEYIQNTGRGDIFQDGDGLWWAVLLGVRKNHGRYPLGRETLLTPMTWPNGGWPILKTVKTKMERQDAKVPCGLPCSVGTSKEQVQATVLVDSGANGIAFIDQTFMRKNEFRGFFLN
jgi:beta-xylosidase